MLIFGLIFFANRFFQKINESQGKLTYLLSVNEQDNLILSIEEQNELYFSFTPQSSLKVQVPGGYGEYSFAGMILLAQSENNYDIAKNSSSWVIGGFVDRYFILTKNPLNLTLKDGARIPLRYILTPPSFVKTDMNLWERLAFWYKTRRVGVREYIVIKSNFSKNDENDLEEKKFAQNVYSQSYEGFFFLKKIRDENLRVKLVYYESASALKLSRVLRGVGMRVVDLQPSKETSDYCTIKLGETINNKAIPGSLDFLKKIDNSCILLPEKSNGVDLEVYFGKKTEAVWK